MLLQLLRNAVFPSRPFLVYVSPQNPVNGIGRQLETSIRNNGTLLDTGEEVGVRCGGGLSKELLSVVPVYENVTFGGTDFVLRMAMKTNTSIWLSEMRDPPLTCRSSWISFP
jgi:hypothetical protein